MLVFLKILIISTFVCVLYQDIRERMVYWFLYPLIGIQGFLIQLYYIPLDAILIYSIINILLILVLITISYLYFRFFLNRKYINESIGLGDLLLFVFLSFAFPTITFWILFVISLLLSLVLFILIKQTNNEIKTIPLAGYMSLFFGFMYIVTLFTNKNILYLN